MRHVGGAFRSHHLEALGALLRSGSAGQRGWLLRSVHRAVEPLRGRAIHGREASRDVERGGGSRGRDGDFAVGWGMESGRAGFRGVAIGSFERWYAHGRREQMIHKNAGWRAVAGTLLVL